MQYTPAIIAFSHLRWDFVYQRPQHLLSRLAARHRVIFMEEPVPGARASRSADRSATPARPGAPRPPRSS